MNNNDARAAVMAPMFSGKGDQPPFTADTSNRDNGLIYRMNPAQGPDAVASSKLDFSREDAIEYAKQHNIPIAQSTTKIYSRDRNIWHISHEGGELEDPANAPTDGIWMLTKSPKEAPDTAGEVTIGFEKGIPVSVNGKKMKAFELLEALNAIGAEHGTTVCVDVREGDVDRRQTLGRDGRLLFPGGDVGDDFTFAR